MQTIALIFQGTKVPKMTVSPLKKQLENKSHQEQSPKEKAVVTKHLFNVLPSIATLVIGSFTRKILVLFYQSLFGWKYFFNQPFEINLIEIILQVHARTLVS